MTGDKTDIIACNQARIASVKIPLAGLEVPL